MFGKKPPADPTYECSLLYHGPMAHELTTQEQEAQVYRAIVETAIRCDGAQSLDGQGFSGVDTKFGRRIAAVPHAQWTADVQAEANKIILKYRQQVLTWTEGQVDVGALPIVRDAQDNGTNYAGRNEARNYEKRAKHLEARQINVVDGRLGIRWANGDPDFSLFLKLVQALPGRRWDGARKVNLVNASPQVEVFVDEYDFTVSPEAEALLKRATVNLPHGPQAEPVQVDYQIWLGEDGRVVIKTNLTAPGAPAADAVRDLPGRSFNRGLYANTANATPQVLAFAEKFRLNIHPDAVRACETAAAALGSQDGSGLSQTDLDTVLNAVSRCGKPEDLPAAFVIMLKEILP